MLRLFFSFSIEEDTKSITGPDVFIILDTDNVFYDINTVFLCNLSSG